MAFAFLSLIVVLALLGIGWAVVNYDTNEEIRERRFEAQRSTPEPELKPVKESVFNDDFFRSSFLRASRAVEPRSSVGASTFSHSSQESSDSTASSLHQAAIEKIKK